MDRIAGSKTPIVAAIDGSCLGGGLEVALACHYRIASSSSKTMMGVPEVMLGLLPGAGGTQRLPKLVGIQAALTMATTGQNIRPAKAKKMGLVDGVADPNALEHAAVLAAKGLADGSVKKGGGKKKALMAKLLEDNPVGRAVLFNQAGKMIAKKAGSHYPAPAAILECIKAGVEGGHKAGSAKEAAEFGRLGMTPVSAALRSIFHGQTACKKNPYGKPSRRLDTVGVLGAGLMGAGIAEVTAQAGYNVLLKDKFGAGLDRGLAQIDADLAPRVKKRAMSKFDKDKLVSSIVGLAEDVAPADAWKKHFSQADLVIEAVFEDLGLKHKVIAEMEEVLPEHAVFASNTSAIPIADLAKGSKRPEQVVGMHYFSPVPKMPLLEVIPHEGTDKDVCAAAVAVGLKQKKTVITVKDVPGFYVNRCLGPFLVEGVALLQEGADPEKLDKAMKSFGMPVGPITLADEVGVDVAYHVASFLGDKLEDRMDGADVGMMKEMVDAGILGRKAGKGYYSYGGGKGGKGRVINQEAVSILNKYRASAPQRVEDVEASVLQERMMSRFLKEAILCLQDDIIKGPVDGDIGAVFGIGFPPFLGGPFRYADALGTAKLADMMSRYADQLGGHFAPPQLLVDMAKTNAKFHK
jgi:enoyl-CoA hydratase/long-chain 3-hydroxyacyl-CoA dehydrogenase